MVKNKWLKICLFMLMSTLLTSCWDKVEIENRGFVVSIGIDASEDKEKRYTVTMGIPDTGELSGKNGDSGSKTLKVANENTVSAAMRLIDSYSSHKLYFGHTKVCIFSEEVMKDESLFKEAIDALERNKQLGRKVIILATEETANEILSAKASHEPMIGMYITNYYKNNSGGSAKAFQYDLGEVVAKLRETGNVILPKICLEDMAELPIKNKETKEQSKEETQKKEEEKSQEEEASDDKEIKIGGAAVIKDFKFVGWLDDTQTKGYAWVENQAVGSQVVTEYDNVVVPMKIKGTTHKIKIQEEDSTLTAYISIDVRGEIEEFIFDNETLYDNETMEKLKNQYQQVIQEQILETADYFQKEYKMDGFDFLNTLRKQNYEVYKKYKDNWEEAFQNMRIRPIISVKITNTGAIK